MERLLSQVAEVQMGYSFRAGLIAAADGKLRVIQMKDLSEDDVVKCADLVQIDLDQVGERHLVKQGDLVFRSRGQVLSAALLSEKVDHAVVAAPLLRVRIREQGAVLPEYLSWYIGQAEAQRYLRSRHEGTSVGMISAQQLNNLPVQIPPVSRQLLIVEMATLLARETKLTQQLQERRGKLISALLLAEARKA